MINAINVVVFNVIFSLRFLLGLRLAALSIMALFLGTGGLRVKASVYSAQITCSFFHQVPEALFSKAELC